MENLVRPNLNFLSSVDLNFKEQKIYFRKCYHNDQISFPSFDQKIFLISKFVSQDAATNYIPTTPKRLCGRRVGRLEEELGQALRRS